MKTDVEMPALKKRVPQVGEYCLGTDGVTVLRRMDGLLGRTALGMSDEEKRAYYYRVSDGKILWDSYTHEYVILTQTVKARFAPAE